MMLSPEQHYHFINNRLLSHKSSFQAWKCVSFGCSLLVMILLLSKYYEVNSDLKLLKGIDRLLLAQETSNGTLTWPPVAIDMVLPASNESNFGMESLESNGTMLMSHMHMSLSREQTGNQLLRQEVGAFVAEFKAAKSTLGLSSLLVAIYIVSWILMTLAINDTRISNDISLRNILLLSVFGAIDVAASIGFVMVRVIMFSVKNSTFAIEILGSSGLRDTPVKLSADQLTAFTALRLIAMRSCAAYTDLYVSTLIALLTILRLYAIVRAITYYRKLRRNSTERGLPVGLVGSEHKSIWSSAGLYNHPPGATHLFAAHHHHLISTPPNRQQLHQPTKLQQLPERAGSPGSLMMDHNHHHHHPQSATLERGPFRLTSSYEPTQAHHDQLLYNHHHQQQQQHGEFLDAPKSTFRTAYQSSGSVPPPSKLMFSSPTQLSKQPPAPQPPPPPPPPPSPPFSKSPNTRQQPLAAAAGGRSKLKTTNSKLITSSQSQQPQFIFRHSSAATLNRLPPPPPLPKQRTTNLRYATTSATPNLNPNSSAPNLLFMTGAKASSYLGPLSSIHHTRDDLTGDQCESDPPRRRRRTPVQLAGDTGSGRSKSLRRQGAAEGRTLVMDNGESEDDEGELAVVLDEQYGRGGLLHHLNSSQQDMLSPRAHDPEMRRHSSQTLGTAYRLLDPDQLDKIGLRLLRPTGGSGSKRPAANASSSRYRHANRYKQILVPHTLETARLSKGAASQARLEIATSSGRKAAAAAAAASRNSSATSGSSSSLEDDEDESDRSRTHRERRRRRAERHQSAALPLREEFVAEAAASAAGGENGDLAATRLFELNGGNGQSYLLGKYYYA